LRNLFSSNSKKSPLDKRYLRQTRKRTNSRQFKRKRQMATRGERAADKALNERHSKMLKDLMMRPDNRRCADCRKRDPRWASWNLGIFMCIRCSGIHRSLGVHISKVKSADLDTWTPEQVEVPIC
jgi:hypothetical protein